MSPGKEKFGWSGLILAIVIGLLFIVPGTLSIGDYFDGLNFANNELQNWAETTGTVVEAHVTRVEEGGDEDNPGTPTTYFSYTMVFETPDGMITAEGGASDAGVLAGKYSEKAYDVFNAGDEMAIIYDPDNPQDFLLGSKAERTANTKSLMGLIAPGIAVLAGAAIIFFCAKVAIDDARKRNNANEQNPAGLEQEDDK